MITIHEYSPEIRDKWNRFVKESRNGTFLHLREYMEYHKDRFTDMSLIASSGNKVIAILPANIKGNVLYSHEGLTYGGWLTNCKHADVVTMIEIFDSMVNYLKVKGINKIIYKPVPHIYHKYPAEEDIYVLFRLKADLIVSNVSAVLPLNDPLKFNENSRRAVKFALSNSIEVSESYDLDTFWNILTDNLNSRYNTPPVHSVDEIKYLKTLFPDNIKLFTAHKRLKMLGGVLIYDTGSVAHAQYIAASPEGKEEKVLPLVFRHLIHDIYPHYKYFDFGTSNENGGTYLNKGLSMQKTGMGGRAIVYNTYQILI